MLGWPWGPWKQAWWQLKTPIPRITPIQRASQRADKFYTRFIELYLALCTPEKDRAGRIRIRERNSKGNSVCLDLERTVNAPRVSFVPIQPRF